MIVQIQRDITRVAIGLSNCVKDISKLRLIIASGQYDTPNNPNGSPWVLTGCWWGLHPTGVDIANYRTEITPVTIEPLEVDTTGKIVFMVGDLFEGLPYGRYTGMLVYFEEEPKPFNLDHFLGTKPVTDRGIPQEYVSKSCDDCYTPNTPLPIIEKKPVHQFTSYFDIDLVPEMSSVDSVDTVAKQCCFFL